MNHFTYKENILREFGGKRRKQLDGMLDKYIKLYREWKFENERDIQVLKRQLMKRRNGEERDIIYYICRSEFMKYQGATFEESVNNLKIANLSSYDKARALIYFCKVWSMEWHPIAELDPEYVNAFLTLIDMTREMEYDEMCLNYRYFESVKL